MKFRKTFVRSPFVCAALSALFAACGGAGTNAELSGGPAANGAPPTAAPRVPDDARGGRIYDNWRAEKELEKSFTPDSAKTPELDGTGGPNGNGTLNDGAGKPLANTGHDYRLKNLFGWDLRGAEGIYGPEFQKKSTVVAQNLLTDKRSPAELRAFFARGADGLPALGAVLDDADLDDLVAYVVKTRSRDLAHPEAIFALDKAAPKNFVLLQGGDAERGKQRYAAACAKCHGADGRKVAIDEVHSVGTISRSSGYEIWFKILNGQPGTAMTRQVAEAGGAEQSQAVLDLLAALCDRKAFPALESGKDVPDGDARCGAYLR
ncbi:MAG TPA: c-type cytochrome [Polyangium sp.]|nr:c-type cytochrome [Polyangium sp.]